MAIPTEFLPAAQPEAVAPLALVTGAARRLGAAFARALAEDGFRIAIHCHQSAAQAQALAAELRAAGCPEPCIVRADLAGIEAAQTLFAQLPEPPCVLVNSASLFREDQLQRIDPDLWDRHFAINLRAPALLSAAMASHLPPGRNGLIVNITDAKLLAPNPDHFSYTLSKYGLAGLTEMSARALAPRIRVNAIAPAVTLISGPQSAANFAAAQKLNALQRGVTPADLVRALRYLVQTPTVTGQTLAVESGQRFLALPRDVAYMADS